MTPSRKKPWTKIISKSGPDATKDSHTDNFQYCHSRPLQYQLKEVQHLRSTAESPSRDDLITLNSRDGLKNPTVGGKKESIFRRCIAQNTETQPGTIERIKEKREKLTPKK